MAGFKRTNIQGHTIVADPEFVRLLRRQSTALLERLFREAQEQGQAQVELQGLHYVLHRHSDHTFTLDPLSASGSAAGNFI